MTTTFATNGMTAQGQQDLVVDAQGVSRKFVVGGQDIWAVRDVSLQVARGEFVALIGRSGSGKTTLLNLIAGLDSPTSGHVTIDGENITEYSERQLTQLRRHRVGFVFQSFGLLPLLSAYENIELSLRIAGAGIRERRRRAEELLEAVGLAGRARHRPYELSGGEQQRVAIARALANSPALILADEPTGELDSTTAVSIFRLLHDLVVEQGVTIITTTHDRTVMELVPRVEEMMDGRLLEPEEQELFRYTVREERSHFAAELPSDVQDEVSAVRTHGADFAPTVEERVAAERAAHPELSEEQARHVFGATCRWRNRRKKSHPWPPPRPPTLPTRPGSRRFPTRSRRAKKKQPSPRPPASIARSGRVRATTNAHGGSDPLSSPLPPCGGRWQSDRGGSAASDQIGLEIGSPPSAFGISPARGGEGTYSKVSLRGDVTE